jgi:hypothetical protein
MELEELKKKFPIILPAIHSLLSAVSSFKSWPFHLHAGYETESIITAIVSAAIGTILGMQKLKKRNQIPVLLALIPVLIFALRKYSSILHQPGSTIAESYVALALFSGIFLIIFYVFTYFERTLAEVFT